MSVLTIINGVKEIHPENVAIVKIGTFYNVYAKDAYIVSYLFGYKLRDVEKNVKSCGFPEMSLRKVIAGLENKNINYMLLDRRNNYEVDEKFEQDGNLNKYNELYNKAKKHFNVADRIENISQYLYDNMNKKDLPGVLKKIEGVILEQKKAQI